MNLAMPPSVRRTILSVLHAERSAEQANIDAILIYERASKKRTNRVEACKAKIAELTSAIVHVAGEAENPKEPKA